MLAAKNGKHFELCDAFSFNQKRLDIFVKV